MNLKIVFTILLLGAVLLISGCTDTQIVQPTAPEKTVWKAENTDEVLTLYDNGTFLYQGTEIDQSGVYRWDGDILTITHTWGTSVLEYKNSTLVLKRNGQIWHKQ